MEIFNNREIAIAIWLIVFLIYISRKGSLKNNILGIVKLFFSYKIFIPYLLGVIYCLIGAKILLDIGLWTNSEMKDTFMWSFITSFATLLKVNEIKDGKKYFKESVKEIFKFAIIFEFILGLYTFSLLTEIIVVPVVTVLFLMSAVAERDEKSEQVAKILKKVLFLLGAFFILYTVYRMVIGVNQLVTRNTLNDFILSPVLSIWFIPFMYFMSLYVRYETIYTTMQFRIKQPALLRYAKMQAFFRFNIDISGFRRWSDNLFVGSVNSKSEIIGSIREIKRLQKVEKNPPVIDNTLGWSPYLAKDFLLEWDISTKHYSHKYENEWSAVSDYKKLEDIFLANNIAFYVKGNEHISNELELVLNINSREYESEALGTFLTYADSLSRKAIGEEIPLKIGSAIVKSKNAKMAISLFVLAVEKINFVDVSKGYTLIYSIKYQ